MPYKDPEVRKIKHNEYMRLRWYPKNRKKHIQMVHAAKVKRVAIIRNIINKLKIKCSQCGEDHPAILDFHHLNPKDKDFELAKAIAGGYSKSRILKEIAKCIVLCSNCHRKLHSNL